MKPPIASTAIKILLVGYFVGLEVTSGQVEDDSNLSRALGTFPGEDTSDDHPRCQPLDIPFCKEMSYNKTMLPNPLGYQSKDEINLEINLFTPIAQINCSPHLKLFVCTFYAPVCVEDGYESKPLRLLPCRSLCESVKQRCLEGFISISGRPWPYVLDCTNFPEKNEKDKIHCVGAESDSASSQASSNSDRSSKQELSNPVIQFSCPKNFEVPHYTLHLNGKSYNNCALPCDNVFLDKNETQIVKSVTAVLTLICFISSLFACITYLIDTDRFKYPVRPIIIISFCQLMVAICYSIAYFTDNKISCNDPAEPPKSLSNLKMVRTTTTGNRKGSCTLLFMALYFFHMASILWWLMMALSWHMIARLKWAPEAVSGVARYFHLTSWTVPAVMAVYLSVLGYIEGDSLTGTCYIDISNQEAIDTFLIYPTIAVVALGLFLLLLGFKSVWDSQEVLKREYSKQTSEHYKLLMRIFGYSFLFISSAFAYVQCVKHEHTNRNNWMLSWLSKECHNREYSIPCPSKDYTNYGPHYSIFLMKISAKMTMGIVSSLFVLSVKTLKSYREVFELCSYKLGS